MAASLLILSGLALLKYVADGNVATAFALVSGACIFTALVLVVLVHLIFRATGLLAYAVAGAVVGGGPLAFLGWIFAFPGGSGFDECFETYCREKGALEGALWGGAIGGLVGLFFWLIRRPDRDAGATAGG
jgi:hypothetical protein